MKPEEIKNIRKKLNLSQRKFADTLGTTVVSVNRWERGKTIISPSYLRQIKILSAKHAV